MKYNQYKRDPVLLTEDDKRILLDYLNACTELDGTSCHAWDLINEKPDEEIQLN